MVEFVLFITLTYGGSHEFNQAFETEERCVEVAKAVAEMARVEDTNCIKQPRRR